MVDANPACWSATFCPLMQSFIQIDRSERSCWLRVLLLCSGMAFGGFG